MAPHFLCCLPIRLGAFFVGVVEFVISGLVAALMWAVIWFNAHPDQLKDLNDNNNTNIQNVQKLSTLQVVSVALFGVSYTLMFLAATFGIIGVIRKRISWIATFLSFMKSYLIVHVILTIVNLVLFFIGLGKGKCGWYGSSNVDCDDSSLSKGAIIGITIAVSIVPLLIEAYGVWILSDCVRYLKDKQVHPMTMYPFSSSGYASVGPTSKDEHVSLTHNNHTGYGHGGV